MQEIRVRSLGQEDPLEEEMAPPPVLLPGESQQTEEPGGLQSMGLQRAGHDWVTNTHYSYLEMKGKRNSLTSFLLRHVYVRL